MKNRFSTLLFIITAVIFVWIFGKMLPDLYLKAGKMNYENGSYAQARKNLRKALLINPKDRDARYYYIRTLLKFPPTLDIQKEVYMISLLNQPDTADLIADRQLSTWRNQITSNIGENYIEQVPYNNKILRWDRTKFPLAVAIEKTQPNVPEYYNIQIKKAFAQWQMSSQNLVTFKFVDNPEEAQITTKIIPSNERKECNYDECKYVMAYTMPKINGDYLAKMTIVFYDANNLNAPLSEREIYNTALHEIGHTLGIMGHSYSKNSLMYMAKEQETQFDIYRSDFQLIAPMDLNTLNLLYKIIPDITNTPLSEYNTEKQFFAPVVMGNPEQVNSRKYQEAKNYIQKAPDLPSGYIDIASAYAEQNDFNNALKSLKKALELSSTKEEKFIVNYNLAITYFNIKDFDKSLEYSQQAYELKADSDVEGFIATIYSHKGENEKAKNLYKSSLEKDPANIINSVNLARLYLNEMNFAQASKTINNLIRVNPESASDPRVKAFSNLTSIFK